MSGYRLTPRAQRDFDEIWVYSKAKWGARRALTYLREIRATIALAAANPDLSPFDEDLPSGYRRRSTGSHFIFYRRGEGFIEIVRVLHQTMDIDSHLR
ncbi:type II toxin-antitoxin system RelE/ParE family toxin [Caulobacter sp.]|uniref:type II toxin-antitoxin system RelE/ParE family toxin n=1 Tax=Caulobacter sp. TaxID=78 RepID=UPI001B1BFAEC|nr:type II toxin-antitoxin system RelE/ParE family toxin [Caulobacter sp.]MBO9543328.1 type II toxin-antitoxin system RelE/ParE family toxin [Caulobacter sp.]